MHRLFIDVTGGMGSFIVFWVVYFVLCALLIKKWDVKKYIAFSSLTAVIGIICIVLLTKGTARSIENIMINTARNDMEYYVSVEYPDAINSTSDPKERLKLSQKALEISLCRIDGIDWDEAKAYAEKNGYELDDYATLVKGPLYYSVILMYITYGILFFVIMIPLKISIDNNLSQTKTVGIILTFFGGTLLVWIIMLIWVNSLKKTEKN